MSRALSPSGIAIDFDRRRFFRQWVGPAGLLDLEASSEVVATLDGARHTVGTEAIYTFFCETGLHHVELRARGRAGSFPWDFGAAYFSVFASADVNVFENVIVRLKYVGEPRLVLGA